MDLSNLFEVIKQSGQLPYIDFVKRWSSDTIKSTTSRYDYMSKNGFVFKQYKNLENAFDLIEETRKKTNRKDYENSALSNVQGSEFINIKNYKDFLNQDDSTFTKIKKVTKVLVENIKTIINLGGLFENDKIIITEDERGVFDFGLASLGLYRPIEFYSEALKEDIKNGVLKNPFEFAKLEPGVINPDNVNKRVIGDFTFFKYSINGKDYDCQKRQRGATKVFNYFSNECLLKPNEDGIILTYYLNNQNKVFNGKGDIRLKYASSNKKSYLIYNKKDDSVKNVDIFMPINFITSVNNATRAIMLWTPYLICAALEEFGIQSRLSALRLGSDRGTQITVSIPVKDYEESTKEAFNRIFALLAKETAAGSFFGFHKIITENEGIQAPATGEKSTSFSEIQYEMRDYMNDIMQRYKNWSEINREKDFINTKVVNPNFQFALPTTLDKLSSSTMKYDDILLNIHKIFFSFYYYMDYLAIEMLPMNKFVKSVNKRIVEDQTFRKLFSVPDTTKEIKDLIRTYVITILVEKYKLVNSGSYSDTLEQKNKKEDAFQSKINLLNESLDSI
jgi:hypothetical protein